VLVWIAGLIRVVLFAPEAAKGIFCFFFKGTSLGVASAGSKALFFVASLGDRGASLLFFGCPSFGDHLLVPQNIISKKLPQIFLGHKIVKFDFLEFLGFNLSCRPVAYLRNIFSIGYTN
jgi:hypothetical protein